MSNFQLPNGPKTHPWIQTYQWLQDPLGYPVFTFSLLSTENISLIFSTIPISSIILAIIPK
jgi:hypothetical protein